MTNTPKIPTGMMARLMAQAIEGNKMIAAGNNNQMEHIKAGDKAVAKEEAK